MAAGVVFLLRDAADRAVELPTQISPDLGGWGLVSFAVFAVIAAPVLEEFVFRGLLFRSIADRKGFWLGAIVSAVVFGAFHLLTPGDGLDVLALGITHVGTGLGLAWIYWTPPEPPREHRRTRRVQSDRGGRDHRGLGGLTCPSSRPRNGSSP